MFSMDAAFCRIYCMKDPIDAFFNLSGIIDLKQKANDFYSFSK